MVPSDSRYIIESVLFFRGNESKNNKKNMHQAKFLYQLAMQRMSRNKKTLTHKRQIDVLRYNLSIKGTPCIEIVLFQDF